jgi:hypothetical protein
MTFLLLLFDICFDKPFSGFGTGFLYFLSDPQPIKQRNNPIRHGQQIRNIMNPKKHKYSIQKSRNFEKNYSIISVYLSLKDIIINNAFNERYNYKKYNYFKTQIER